MDGCVFFMQLWLCECVCVCVIVIVAVCVVTVKITVCTETESLRTIRWDEQFKMGEHEDFFVVCVFVFWLLFC